MSYVAQAYVILIIAGFNLVLSGSVLAQDMRNRTNRAFALLAATTAGWGITAGVYLLVSPSMEPVFELLPRAVYFFGAGTAPAFFFFAVLFNAHERVRSGAVAAAAVGGGLLFILLFFTNLIIAGPLALEDGGRGFLFGPLRFLIDAILIGYFGYALVVLSRRYRTSSTLVRSHIRVVVIGTYTTLLVGGTTNDLLLALNIFTYFWVGPAAMIIWITSIAYSVARLGLFSVRVVAAQLLIISLWVVLLVRVVLSQGPVDLAVNVAFFAAVLPLGVFLISNVTRQVAQRERIALQSAEIAAGNAQQEVLIHFISHEIKGYFAKIEAAFAGIVEGDYGATSPALGAMATHGLEDVRTGASMAMGILDASNLKKGTLSYQMQPFDVSAAAARVVAELGRLARERGIELTLDAPRVCELLGDVSKIERHVLHNIIDNALRYTIAGSVAVRVSGDVGRVVIEVVDTGVGITTEDRAHLFVEGGRGKDAAKVNVHSTGYGLFVAKQVVDAHKGSISVSSGGAGMGTTVQVVLPRGVVTSAGVRA